VNPTKLVGTRRPKSPDTLLVEQALKRTGVPTSVADIRSMTGLDRKRVTAIIANLRQRKDVSYISGEGYVLGQEAYVPPSRVAPAERESVQTRPPLDYTGMAAPVRPGASDHQRYPSRIGDALVYSNK
jgi:hypothetical protein